MAEMSEEQRKALMEKLKNMSPEELREFQKKQCIFCQIIAGKMESKIVYDDDKSIAVLDINPAHAGHILVMPKEHYAIMPQIPDDELKHFGIVIKHLSHAVLKALKVQGTTVFVANGLVAGQRAQHFMIHIIPRYDKDGLPLGIPQKEINEADLRKIRDMLRAKIDGLFGRTTAVVKPQVSQVPPGTVEKTEKRVSKRSKKNDLTAGSPNEKTGPKKVTLDDIADLFKPEDSDDDGGAEERSDDSPHRGRGDDGV